MGGFAEGLSKSAPKGASLGSSWLYLSSNGGSSFQAGPELGPLGDSFGYVLASPAPGVILLTHGDMGQDLIASFNGGHTWTNVYHGELTYLGFTSPLQGVGIVQVNSATSKMIMTFDGGHLSARSPFNPQVLASNPRGRTSPQVRGYLHCSCAASRSHSGPNGSTAEILQSPLVAELRKARGAR